MPTTVVTWSAHAPDNTAMMFKKFGPYSPPVWVDWETSIVSSLFGDNLPCVSCHIQNEGNPWSLTGPGIISGRELQASGPGTASEYTTKLWTKSPICRAGEQTRWDVILFYEGAGIPENDFSITARIHTG